MPESFFWKQIGLQKLLKKRGEAIEFNSQLIEVFNTLI